MFMIQNRQELENAIDALRGEVCRMCVSDDFDEIKSMCQYAKNCIDAICAYNLARHEDNGGQVGG